MSANAITIENVSKRYQITAREPYKALRDVFVNSLKKTFSGKQMTMVGAKKQESHIWALDDVSLEIAQGEVLGVIGRNGAGKTTLLKILSRVTSPTKGRVELNGRVGSLLEVGTGFHPELSGRENIFLYGAILGMKKREIQKKFDQIVDFAEVEKFLDMPVKRYSSGMYMRLAFSVAAHLEPEILLVDEVLAVGDAAFQRKCLGKMGSVKGEGRTVLFVSHNMPVIRGITNRCILLNQGRIEADGTPDDVVEQYLSGGHDELPNTIDTREWPRAEGLGTDLRVILVGIESKTNQARLSTDSSLNLFMDVEVSEPVEEICYGFSVFGIDGTYLFQCHNTNEGAPHVKFDRGKYRVYGKVEKLPLPPGRYYLDIGVRCGTKGLEWLKQLMHFEIEEAESISNSWLKPNDGLTRQVSEWREPERC